MYNTKDKGSVMFKDYFESILAYVDVYNPPVKETLEFVGALIYSVIEKIDITEEEKDEYVEIYNRILRKSLIEKKVNKREACLV